MEFYGSRYAPKRYKIREPVVVSTEYYDYTLDTDDAGSSAYRVMPITYDDCTPSYDIHEDGGYNIQHYGSNVVLPFSACIEIYNNKPVNNYPGRNTPVLVNSDSDEIVINVRHTPNNCCYQQPYYPQHLQQVPKQIRILDRPRHNREKVPKYFRSVCHKFGNIIWRIFFKKY